MDASCPTVCPARAQGQDDLQVPLSREQIGECHPPPCAQIADWPFAHGNAHTMHVPYVFEKTHYLITDLYMGPTWPWARGHLYPLTPPDGRPDASLSSLGSALAS